MVSFGRPIDNVSSSICSGFVSADHVGTVSRMQTKHHILILLLLLDATTIVGHGTPHGRVDDMMTNETGELGTHPSLHY
jgi:hypothetical protein